MTRNIMKKLSFYLLILSIISLEAAVYKGRTAYIGFCKDCHGNGTKMAKKYTGDQWREFLDKKGAVLAKRHLSSKDLDANILAQQAKGYLPYSSVASIHAYFENKSEIILKSMSKSAKKAVKKRIFKYQSRHLRDFFVEFSKDSGKVPACSDDGVGGKASKEELAQAKRIQDAERQRRAKKAAREKAKLARIEKHNQAKQQKEAQKRAREKELARQKALLRQQEQARNAKLQAAKEKARKQKEAKIARDKARKRQKELAKAQKMRRSKMSRNEKIMALVKGKLSKSDMRKLKALLNSK